MALKQLFPSQNYKKLPSGWGISTTPAQPLAAGGSAPRPSSILPLNYTVTQHVFQVRHFHFITVSLSPLPVAKCQLIAKPGHDFTSTILRYLCQKKVPILKIFDDVIACDLWFAPPNQKSWLRQCAPATKQSGVPNKDAEAGSGKRVPLPLLPFISNAKNMNVVQFFAKCMTKSECLLDHYILQRHIFEGLCSLRFGAAPTLINLKMNHVANQLIFKIISVQKFYIFCPKI